MHRFVDRQQELAELDHLAATGQGQLVMVYGRRRVGKTTLLTHWIKRAGLPHLYWVAKRETPELTRSGLARAIWQYAYPQELNPEPPRFSGWEVLFQELARRIEGPTVVCFDEFPYAVESDPSIATHLQAAWDHLFKERPVILILAGSHIGMMVDLQQADAPLHGRFTAQLPVDPLPFSALSEFFPSYEADARVNVYAILGGVPAYLERFDPRLSLEANVRRHLFQRSGMFHSEPTLLVSDLVRETRIYEAILRAVVAGNHTHKEIAQAAGLEKSNVPPYLNRLVDLRLVERRLPATVPFDKRKESRMSRYYLRDPYLRFFYRFIEPHMPIIEFGDTETLWARLSSDFNSFVGGTTFEELCREWVLVKSRLGEFPFRPEVVSSHWSPREQVDVVAINWREKHIFLGECKWFDDGVRGNVLEGLLAKAPAVVPDKDWKAWFGVFTRRGLFPQAYRAAERSGALVVDIRQMDEDFRRAADGDGGLLL